MQQTSHHLSSMTQMQSIWNQSLLAQCQNDKQQYCGAIFVFVGLMQKLIQCLVPTHPLIKQGLDWIRFIYFIVNVRNIYMSKSYLWVVHCNLNSYLKIEKSFVLCQNFNFGPPALMATRPGGPSFHYSILSAY